MVVHEDVILGWQRCAPHQHHHDGSADRGDPHSDTEWPGKSRRRDRWRHRGSPVGDPPLIQALATVVSWPSPNIVSRKAQRKMVASLHRVSAHRYGAISRAWWEVTATVADVLGQRATAGAGVASW